MATLTIKLKSNSEENGYLFTLRKLPGTPIVHLKNMHNLQKSQRTKNINDVLTFLKQTLSIQLLTL